MLERLVAATRAPTADNPWYASLLDWLGRVGELLAAVVAAGVLLAFAWGLYGRTLGRRRDRYRRLVRLGTNAQISFFSSVLGEPPAMRRTEESAVTRFGEAGNRYLEPKTWIECVWIDRDFYVHAVADEDETVHAYSVTTRSKRFRPTFRQPGGWWIERGRLGRLLRLRQIGRHPRIKLGKTRFHELGWPQQSSSWIGAHNMHYFEAYWGANPGFYQWFIYGINDAGYMDAPWDYEQMHTFSWGFGANDVIDPQLALAQAAIDADGAEAQEPDPAHEIIEPEPAYERVQLDEEDVEEPLPAFFDAFRRRARINTYTLLGPELALDDYPFYTPPPQGYPTIFGPNSGRTRTLAGEES
ncbi:MAG: ETEC_3214 domain-containing protein [Gaiellaceae bacterium]